MFQVAFKFLNLGESSLKSLNADQKDLCASSPTYDDPLRLGSAGLRMGLCQPASLKLFQVLAWGGSAQSLIW